MQVASFSRIIIGREQHLAHLFIPVLALALANYYSRTFESARGKVIGLHNSRDYDTISIYSTFLYGIHRATVTHFVIGGCRCFWHKQNV